MIIESLKLQNFLTVQTAQTLNLADQGLTLLQGENGAGKSTIVDSLCWAINNVTARDESGDAVVNNQVKKDCMVQVVLNDDGQRYQITRYRKHKEFKNAVVVEKFTGEGYVDISRSGDRENQVLIEEILGCSKEVFVAAIYAGQEATPDLPKMTDKQLKQLIEEAAGVDKFEAAYQIARDELNDAKRGLETLGAAMASTQAAIESDERALTEVMARHDTFDAQRTVKKDALLVEAQTIKTSLVATNAEYKAVDVDALHARAKELAASIATAQPAMEAHSAAVSLWTREDATHKTALRDLEIATNAARKVRDQITNASTELTKPCTECGKPHTEAELEEYVAHAKTRLQAAVKAAKDINSKATELSESVGRLKALAEAAKEAIPDVSSASTELAGINSQVRASEGLKARLTDLMGRYKRKLDEAEGCLTETNPHASAQEVVNERIAKSRETLAKGELARESLEESVQVKESVAKVFGPAGVRAHILDTVTPFLNEQTNDYLSILSDGKITAVWSTLGETAKGELREKFNISVEHADGGKSFGLLSGGEKRRVRLATMMALQDLVASRADKPLSLFIADEIDAALDAPGMERLMVVLERKARERGTVLVISHSDLRDWCDTVATVVKTPTGSIIEGALVEA